MAVHHQPVSTAAITQVVVYIFTFGHIFLMLWFSVVNMFFNIWESILLQLFCGQLDLIRVFLPRDAIRRARLCHSISSVRPSVCM